jgi:hypothetical protein
MMESISFTSRPLYIRLKSPLYPLDRGLVRPTAGLDAVAKRKDPLPTPAGNRTPVVQPVV